MCRDITNGLRNTRLKFSDSCWLVWTSQMLISPSRPQVTIAWSCDTNPTWPISERKKRTKNARKHQEETCFLKLWEEEQDALGIEKHAPWLPSLCGTWRETYQESIEVGRQGNVGLFAHCSKCTEPILVCWKVERRSHQRVSLSLGRFFDLQALVARFSFRLPIRLGLLVPVSCIQRKNGHLEEKQLQLQT